MYIITCLFAVKENDAITYVKKLHRGDGLLEPCRCGNHVCVKERV